MERYYKIMTFIFQFLTGIFMGCCVVAVIFGLIAIFR